VFHCDESSFTQTSHDGNRVRLAWGQITAVHVYKRDCVTTDQIRLILVNDDLTVWIEVTEDDTGYAELTAELPRRLPGCPSLDQWLQNIVLPPFETQWATLYRREPWPDR
jgi:hypothetical protein